LINFKKPKIKDLEEIYQLINYYASFKQKLLPRTKDNICERLRDFYIATLTKSKFKDEQLVGCVSLHIWSTNISEIKSLAVHGNYQKQGIGKELVQRSLKEAQNLGQKKVFVLTRKISLFKKLGFKEIDRNLLPHKVWNECIFCPKLKECDEVALCLDLR